MSTHALLSASSSDRWLHCTPSARLGENEPDTAGRDAAEGSLAHKIAEICLRGQIIDAQLKTDPLYQPEMLKHAELYADYINTAYMTFTARPHIVIEAQLEYSQHVPQGFGRCDCILIGDSVLHVIDYKYGQNPNNKVFAEGNTQLRLYALGAMQTYRAVYGDSIKTVRMSIVQPRLDHIDEATMSTTDLLQWAEEYVKPRATLAFEGEGEPEPGDWCCWCRVKATCRARAEKMLALEAEGLRLPPALTDAEVGDTLTRAVGIEAYVAQLKDYAEKILLAGGDIPGWKMVEGRKMDKILDVSAAWSALQAAGFDEAVLYTREPISMTAAKKLAGAKQFETLCGQWMEKQPGKPTLVEASDKRKPYSTLVAEAAGLKEGA